MISFLYLSGISFACQAQSKTNVIFDTDANNELDDQHALAYLLFNGNTFHVLGVTVNATRGGGDIVQQSAEAERVMKLCAVAGQVPLFRGANSSFAEIKNHVKEKDFDGSAAVNFIIKEGQVAQTPKLVLLAVGKLTTVALALKKDPSIAKNIRLVWLGSNYPDPGEYNLDNDTVSMNYVLNTPIEFEMVTVRYGKQTGSGYVQATQDEIKQKMPGRGPHIDQPVTGRHGGTFSSFGDYSIDLFDHIDYHGTPPARALYDMVAVSIVKNPSWGHRTEIHRPILINNKWIERTDNPRTVIVWENFNKAEIMNDFYNSMEHYVIVK
jgi:purine nucleosidase